MQYILYAWLYSFNIIVYLYLVSGVPYQVVVIAYTSAGKGEESNPSEPFFSEQLAPTKSVENVKINRLSETSVNVTWTPLTFREARGFPVYRVTLTAQSAGSHKRRQIPSMETSNIYIVFTDLDSTRSYQVIVGVRSMGGPNTFTDATSVQGVYIFVK